MMYKFKYKRLADAKARSMRKKGYTANVYKALGAYPWHCSVKRK